MALEEGTIEILLTTTPEQVLLLPEIDSKIRTIRAIHPVEEQIQQTLVAKAIQEPTRQAQEATVIRLQDRIALVQTLAAAVMAEDLLVAEEEEDNFCF
jgi:hypothetical protein